ncbi:MAG: hypothetical protein Q9191_008154, partial [Dirinaria sp. TL-2023a]
TQESQPYTRHADHTPNTAVLESDVYVLALCTDPAHQECMTRLREEHFPTKVNHVDAHVALFRALPGSQLDTIRQDIREVAEAHSPFLIRTAGAHVINRGVIIKVHAPSASVIHARLQERWQSFLSKQDQKFNKAHYTIQNFVKMPFARKTRDAVETSFKGSTGVVTGLTLYRYDKGFWRDGQTFDLMKEEVENENERLEELRN